MEDIFAFLDGILHNNNRQWFQEHKDEYLKAQGKFNEIAEQIIAGVQQFDETCQGLTLKDCTYRFYRDTRFSSDKRPYKTHFGVFVCPGGKKSMKSGYYFHIEPEGAEYLGRNMLCTGMYCPDTAMLKSIRDGVLFDAEPLVKSIKKAKHFTCDTSRNMVRVPNGYPKDHPQAELFKHRDWLLEREIPKDMLYSKRLVEWALEEFQTTRDFCQTLNRMIEFEEDC